MGRNRRAGSGNEIRVIDDLGSNVVREITEQLNVAEICSMREIETNSGQEKHVCLGFFEHPVHIKQIAIANLQNNALIAAGTTIKLHTRTAADADVVGGTGTEGTTFGVTGFATNNFPAKSIKFLKQIDGVAIGDTVTGKKSNIIIPKQTLIYVSFNNAEVGVRTIGVSLIASPTDKMRLEPSDIAKALDVNSAHFRRSTRKS